MDPRPSTQAPEPNLRLLRRPRPLLVPVTASSLCLFRLGEQCNNKCPMCSNSGESAALYPPAVELLQRADFLASRGFRRVILTGGEPTLHPAFWPVVERLQQQKIAWDLNTNGRNFAALDMAARAMESGLERAIVSLHSHRSQASQIMSGIGDRGHQEILAGIAQLRAAGCDVTINCVISKQNQGELCDFLAWCIREFGADIKVKLCAPSHLGKGGQWSGIDLQYSDIQNELRAALDLAEAQGWHLQFEAVPHCILGRHDLSNISRSGFGETHYLDDLSGDRVYSIGEIEADLTVFAPVCSQCVARRSCAGVGCDYAERYGVAELQAL